MKRNGTQKICFVVGVCTQEENARLTQSHREAIAAQADARTSAAKSLGKTVPRYLLSGLRAERSSFLLSVRLIPVPLVFVCAAEAKAELAEMRAQKYAEAERISTAESEYTAATLALRLSLIHI